jgi:hypothetical protein
MEVALFWATAATLGLITAALMAAITWAIVETWGERMPLLSVAFAAMLFACAGVIAMLGIYCFG